MKIKAAVVREKGGPFKIEEIDLDEPRDDEVLIRIVGSGICHTDLVARDQHMPVPLPAVFGHEGSGVVEKVGDRVTKVKPGDHVVMSYLSCGACIPCKTSALTYCMNFLKLNFSGVRTDGTPTMRKNGQTIHGVFFGQSSFASYALAKESNVVKVRKDVPLEILGPLGCGIQTGAGGVINALHPKAGSSIAVFGAGSVGQSSILGAVVCGCTTIIAVDINDERLKKAKEFGATHTINPNKTDPIQEIQKITGAGVEYSLECTGSSKVFRQAVDALSRMGVCGLIGVAPHGTEVSLDMETILNGRMVRGIVEGDSIPDIFIPQLIELHKQGRFPFDRMIEFYSLDQINKGAKDSEKGRVLKPVVRP
jgi:aryl-alcohol dehydrogenase